MTIFFPMSSERSSCKYKSLSLPQVGGFVHPDDQRVPVRHQHPLPKATWSSNTFNDENIYSDTLA